VDDTARVADAVRSRNGSMMLYLDRKTGKVPDRLILTNPPNGCEEVAGSLLTITDDAVHIAGVLWAVRRNRYLTLAAKGKK
jgi:hypothetical protein